MNGVVAGVIVPVVALFDGIPLRFCAAKGNIGQTGAFIERTVPDTGDAIGLSKQDNEAKLFL